MKRLIAALSFFTRIPFWRLSSLESRHYENIVPMWPVAGILTGVVMSCTFYMTSLVLPNTVAIVIAMISRILMTGGLHEDGFADFCDGFGGGSTGLPDKDRERTLRIMKDSFIGTYGVLGLILYFLLLWNILYSLSDLLPLWKMMICMIVVDVFSKFMSSMIVYFLPYARDAENAKNKIVYNKGSRPYIAMFLSVVTLNAPILFLLFRWMKNRIGGYTGDCCGATFMLMELYNYLILLILCERFL
ncbi:MAG: adenosylcobinamide-GDP ribazoletransferase [Paludibacteraceae bacterium]|nr:adenosylcobinamide-GDP ribazoletransferase [Paludibacteraceae bacterium]MEE1085216.1 adenosylcobinamide-GDP ribazoletransferase [Paludibacteraceae bacterium]